MDRQVAARQPSKIPAGLKQSVFELRIVIEAPVEEVFVVFADPVKSAVAAGSPVPKRVLRSGATEGISWSVRIGFCQKAHYAITDCVRPSRVTKNITGSICARVEDFIEPTGENTEIVRRFTVSRLPALVTLATYRNAQQQFLEQIKDSLEARSMEKKMR